MTLPVQDAALPDAPAPAPAPPRFLVPVPVLIAAGVLLLILPAVLGGYPLQLATEALCWALAAAALDLMVGYLGLTPLGSVAMWGLGAYAAALLVGAGVPLPLALAVAAALGAAYSALTAPLALRAGGIFFLMVTLAFAQMMQVVADKWTAVTGGTDGLSFSSGLSDLELYALTAALAVAGLLFLTRLVRSPFGRVLEAIRQNEGRARALGYPVFAYKYGAVLVASAFIALAGALAALHRGIVTPGDLFWLQSAIMLIMVLLGGARSLWGPVVGAVLYIFVQAGLSSVAASWWIGWTGMIGILLILIALLGRGGLWSLIERRRA